MNFMFAQLNNIEIPEGRFDIIPSDTLENIEVYLASPSCLLKYKNELMTDIVSQSSIFSDLGKYDTMALLRKPMICVWSETEEKELKFENKEMADKYYSRKGILYSDLVSIFTIGLWLVKDCSVYSNLYYWCNTDTGYSVKARRGFQRMNGQGKMSVVSFSKEEIELALNYMVPILEIMFSEKNINEEVEIIYSQETMVMNIESAVKNRGDSFSRIFILLQLARKTGLIFEKISWYCALLECFFAIERDHKKNISEMTAGFISNDKQEQNTILRDMRLAYKIRSEFVHGNVISVFNDNVQIRYLSGKVDEYVRKTLRKAISDNNFNYTNTAKDVKRVREYLTKEIKKFE